MPSARRKSLEALRFETHTGGACLLVLDIHSLSELNFLLLLPCASAERAFPLLDMAGEIGLTW
jgi:hypothetical protein